ncbi:MAG TPA: RNase H family protein, partial [Thermoanaerobaculia bacterium]
DPGSGKHREISGGEPHATNNRMELTAAIRALEALKRPCRVRLFTDSLYLKKGITQWLPDWIARGWKRKTGELQNEDLWRRLAELIQEHDVRWDWVKGHAGNRWNERADELATLEIRKQRGGTAAGPRPQAEVFLRVSCAKGKGGWAALIRRDGEEEVLSGGFASITPNQLDLLGAIAALESLPPGISVAIHTGSDYLRNGATRWIDGWKRRAWKTQEGQPVLNRDLWERLEKAMAARRITWPETKGRELPEMKDLGARAKEAAG